jgi:hypothetical protein
MTERISAKTLEDRGFRFLARQVVAEAVKSVAIASMVGGWVAQIKNRNSKIKNSVVIFSLPPDSEGRFIKIVPV